MSSTDTVLKLKLKIYEKIGQMPNDQLIYMNERLLCDTETLGQARIDPHELAVHPLTLIVQYMGDIQTEPRRLERGFADTALSHD
ncbi:hypothetical protein Tcan_02265 [Toxocara canis]|uniref:Ubiquitin-like domain-containing protein n=2 Tax=Toxocara canis TaxID=6265 RepID=A0A0B2UPX5_TOXCA|nr:hypothetical protein Tcan_02265 [Toxocara canis]VDM38874.1 unnamed protein product [Toxocara canis]